MNYLFNKSEAVHRNTAWCMLHVRVLCQTCRTFCLKDFLSYTHVKQLCNITCIIYNILVSPKITMLYTILTEN
jgi:hypothetical protein